MDNSNRIAELEERKRQIDVEIAFHKGAKIKAKVKTWNGWIDVSVQNLSGKHAITV